MTPDDDEALAAEVHGVYCAQYEKNFGAPYWTGGDYAKLDEPVKAYDRALVAWHGRKLREALGALEAQSEINLAQMKGALLEVTAATKPVVEEVVRLRREVAAWREDCAREVENKEYYRGLVERIGRLYDPQCYTADDGRRHPDVLCAKVPELVEAAFTPWRCDAHGKSTCHDCAAGAAATPMKLTETFAAMRRDGQGLTADQEATVRKGIGII